MEDLTSYPSGSSPQDIQYGNLRRDLDELKTDVKELCGETKKQSTDIAFIRGKLEGKTEKEEKTFKVKHGIIMVGLGSVLSFLAAKFS